MFRTLRPLGRPVTDLKCSCIQAVNKKTPFSSRKSNWTAVFCIDPLNTIIDRPYSVEKPGLYPSPDITLLLPPPGPTALEQDQHSHRFSSHSNPRRKLLTRAVRASCSSCVWCDTPRSFRTQRHNAANHSGYRKIVCIAESRELREACTVGVADSPLRRA